MQHKWGFHPQLPDFRDYKFPKEKITLPVKTNNIALMPLVYDQLTLGSCTANGIAGLIHYDLIKQKLPVFIPSRLFIYYNERAMEGTIRQDSGANPRDGIKSIAKQGVCSENEWGYYVSKYRTQPNQQCYADALKNIAILYQSVPINITDLKSVLASGFPVGFGFTVYSSFESNQVAKTGIVPMPSKNESVLGGHYVVAVDYDDSKMMVLCRNSWGSSWGIKGNFYLPYAYFTNELTSDYWVVTNIKLGCHA